MRMIRSLFFGGLAMLAAAMFISMPASALDRDPGIYSTRAEVLAYYAMPDVAPHDAIMAERQVEIVRSRNAHRAVYIRQNQPTSTWRFAVDAYSRIDPHICLG